uniref:Cytochrome P450 n=1 Tax=Oryza rufipogon TaxID=4529 RepID=A0A0E0Q921_ORYRU
MSMDSSMLLALLLALFIPILLHLVTRRKYASYNLPSGSLGFPLIGQTISLLRALRKNTDYQWYQDRIKKYGPVSKMSVFGSPTVLLTGPAANRFAFCNPDLIFTQTKALNALVGGEELKQVRSAVQGYLRPEMVAPLAKRLTFNITCSVFFGEEAGPIREALATDFEALVKATLSIPVNIPFTKFNKGLSASWRIRKLLSRIARYETTSVLIIFLLRYLANEPDILGNITEEQEEIARNKGPNEPLTWDDVSRMKYTWKVAMETLRTVPAIFGSFRTAIKDIEYQGYHIPKGWQIFTDQIVTHLDTNFFDGPRKFDPARFHNQSSIPPYCFVPFGGGPRMCPGNEFAKTGTLVAMHYLVRQFRWKLCCKEEGKILLQCLFLDSQLILRPEAPLDMLILRVIHMRKYSSYNLPPGSLGFPVIGQSISLLRALRSNTDYQWYQDRIKKYGPVSKMSVFGSPMVLLTGPAANRFVFSNQDLIITETKAANALIGRSILTLSGEELKQVRSALQGYLRTEMVTKCIRKMDEEVRRHIDLNWVGQKTVTVAPLAKRLTFDIICSVIFGQGAGPIREALAADFKKMVQAMLSIPVNIPFTKFNKGLSASRRVRKVLRQIARDREAALQQGHSSSADDFFTYMLVLRSEGTHSLTVEDIVDNAILLLLAGYETSSVLITFLLRYLANEPDILGKITEEQEEIARYKGPDEPLTWDDVSRMKYTWKVAMETLQTVPPIFGSLRTAIKDIEYQGYHIPKGWQVFTAIIITHLDANFFDDPNKFNPARFHNQSSVPPYCFVPFGGGPRMCPGNEFARTETLVAMNYLVRQFRWKLCCKDEEVLPSEMSRMARQVAHILRLERRPSAARGSPSAALTAGRWRCASGQASPPASYLQDAPQQAGSAVRERNNSGLPIYIHVYKSTS